MDPDDEDEDDLHIDDDDRVYKNPRNFPNTHCPRDEEKAVFMVSLMYVLIRIRDMICNYKSVGRFVKGKRVRERGSSIRDIR